MRSFILAAVAVLALASAADAATSSAPPKTPAGPYKADAGGRCHAANGQIVAGALCKVVAPNCKTGVACGNTCIPKGAVCHK